MTRHLCTTLLLLACLVGMTTPTIAAAQAGKPELKVADGFWPITSIKYVPTTAMWVFPISKERRWIGYADGQQMTAVKFYEIAGQDDVVSRLKKRRNRGCALTALGYGALSVAQAYSANIISDSTAKPMIPMTAIIIGGPTAFIGLHTPAIDLHTLAFLGTQKADAQKVAVQHNADR
jgi:hypothetical protein